MDSYWTTGQAADHWNVSERRVGFLCGQGRVEGARKDGRTWLIPSGAPKPADMRVRSGAYVRRPAPGDLPLPLGNSSFPEVAAQFHYVDKTLMIKDLIDEKAKVSLFTRPRRFGKTLNMSMLRTFFERSENDTSVYFRDKKIWACGRKYREMQGRYPVVFLSFKDLRQGSWEETLLALGLAVQGEYARHPELEGCADRRDARDYRRMVEAGRFDTGLAFSIRRLTEMLHRYWGIAPMVVIDEYDTPLTQAHLKGFYPEAALFMRNLFSSALKDNESLTAAFLTGILRVAKESIFSGLNNLRVHSVLDGAYSQYFGFSAEEVEALAAGRGASDKVGEMRDWYDGYNFGGREMYNPWSVLSYFAEGCRPGAYWVSTSSNDLVGELLSNAPQEVWDTLWSLVQGGTVPTTVDPSAAFADLPSGTSSIYSFLVVTGYLKALNPRSLNDGAYVCEAAIPNRELALVFRREILQRFSAIVPPLAAGRIWLAIQSGVATDIQAELERLLLESASYHDAGSESFYHGLMMGLGAAMDGYRLASDRESGLGRYDLMLTPLRPNLPGVVIELKALKGASPGKLEEAAGKALDQIGRLRYVTELEASGARRILMLGAAFSGKSVRVAASWEAGA